MDRILEEIKRIEATCIHYDKQNEDYFEYRKGKIPILISAPHGARHWRNRGWKEEDEYTASIAIKLAEQTGAHVIYVKNATKEDPNYNEVNSYKDAIKQIVKSNKIKFILDLHGADKRRNFKVAVGILDKKSERCSCPSFKDLIQNSFSNFQEDIFNLEGLSAANPGTVTYYAINSLGIEAAQVEINARFRIIARKSDSSKAKIGEEPDYKANENDILDFLKVLERVIVEINKKIENGVSVNTINPNRLINVVTLLSQRKDEMDSYINAW